VKARQRAVPLEIDRIAIRIRNSGMQAVGRAPMIHATRHILLTSLDTLGHPLAELTVYFCSEWRIQQLNRDFLGNDAPTDVLSFPSGEAPYIGDIAISLRYTERRAREEGRPFEDDVALLLVHGLLHLLGHDHDTVARKKKMWKQQAALLAPFGEHPMPPIPMVPKKR
jgi:probable rRNA maturation factor